MPRETKYWIVVASKDHVMKGVDGGFMQANHGKEAPLKRMQKDDYIIFYSGKMFMDKPEKCQKFTAIGKVSDDVIYQAEVSESFRPFRRNVSFLKSRGASILPLIEKLQFIPDKQHWGFPFRFGFFEIQKHDFDLIEKEMLR